MPPVKIRYLGLIPMTRRGYLLALAGAVGVAGVTLGVFAFLGRLPPISTLWEQHPALNRPGLAPWFLSNLYRILLILSFAAVLEVIHVLRRFAQKEAEQQIPPTPGST